VYRITISLTRAHLRERAPALSPQVYCFTDRRSGTECNEGKSDFSLKRSSATRQRLRFSAAQPQFLPLLLASTSSSSSSPSPVHTLMDEALSWSDASAACQATGQHLAIVQSAAENTLLVTAADGNHVWMDGTDAVSEGASEGAWKWSSSGAPLSYTNWASGEPNNSGNDEDCLVLMANLEGR